MSFIITRFTPEDFEGIWEIFSRVIASGDTYAYSPNTTKQEAYCAWINSENHVYVAKKDHKIIGTYTISTNQPALGSHIAKAAYMVHPDYLKQGIGTLLAQHSFSEAKKLGFKAMQFNFVVSTNFAAVNLWKKLGFKIIGVTPNGFNHSRRSLYY